MAGVRGAAHVCLWCRGPWGGCVGRPALWIGGGKAAGCWRARVFCLHDRIRKLDGEGDVPESGTSPAISAFFDGDVPVLRTSPSLRACEREHQRRFLLPANEKTGCGERWSGCMLPGKGICLPDGRRSSRRTDAASENRRNLLLLSNCQEENSRRLLMTRSPIRSGIS